MKSKCDKTEVSRQRSQIYYLKKELKRLQKEVKMLLEDAKFLRQQNTSLIENLNCQTKVADGYFKKLLEVTELFNATQRKTTLTLPRV